VSATGAERPQGQGGIARAMPAALVILSTLLAAPLAAQTSAQSPVPAAPTASPSARLEVCAACHGADGRSRLAGVPSLAGQPRLFLENRLVMIREGLSVVPEMKGLLEPLSDAELTELSRHFAALPPPPAATPRDAARAARGARIAERTLCGSCHLPDHRGRDQIPRLAGQREDYLLASMRQFLAGQVKGRDTAMINALLGLADADLVDLAHYLATAGAPAP
jgi:cytochrome c553